MQRTVIFVSTLIVVFQYSGMAQSSDKVEPATNIDTVLSKSTDTVFDADTASIQPKQQRHLAFYMFGGWGAIPNDWRISNYYGLRLFSYGVNYSNIRPESIPAYSNEIVPGDAGPIIHYKKRGRGVDLSYFYDVTNVLSLRANIGYYSNQYVELAYSQSAGVHYIVKAGTEWQFAAGASIFADIEAGWPISWIRYIVGLDGNTCRGFGIIWGWGGRI